MGDITAITANPADIGYSPALPVELALREHTPEELRVEYGYSPEEWNRLSHDANFLADVARACEMVRKEGMSFKLKAQLQADELLKTSWRLIHNPETPSSVKADLLKATIRWAGHDERTPAAAATANAGGLQINIQFNNPPPGYATPDTAHTTLEHDG